MPFGARAIPAPAMFSKGSGGVVDDEGGEVIEEGEDEGGVEEVGE